MNYTVDWLPAAEQELADIWLRATDRDTITQAAYALDLRLQDDPNDTCESRPSGRRIAFAFPMGILFRVLSDQQLVQVVHVWRIERRKR